METQTESTWGKQQITHREGKQEVDDEENKIKQEVGKYAIVAVQVLSLWISKYSSFWIWCDVCIKTNENNYIMEYQKVWMF